MSAIPPIAFRWDGEAMVPSHKIVADKHFVIGERYVLAEHQERSRASHAHFFAALHDLWLNLPEETSARFTTEEALRKFCLIKAGYCDSRSIVAASKAEAARLARFIAPMDPFSIVHVSEALVIVYTAQSQSMKAMGRKVFQESKDRVLQEAAALVGVRPDQARAA